MPNIHQYDAGTDIGLRTDDRAASSTANAGRRITALYNTAAEAQGDTGRRIASAITDAGRVAVDFVTNREINRGAAEAATVISTLDQKWNATIKNADPNDPSVAAKFKEDTVEPTLQKLKEGFITEGGQKFAEARVEQFRNHFVSKTASDMATMAGIAVRNNINTMTNQLSNMAISDPTSVKTSLKMVEDSVSHMVDSSPTLTGPEAARVKSEVMQASQAAIVKAAALGAINANPEAGLKKFSSPEYSKYLSGADLKAMEQQAKSVQRAERVDESYRRSLELQAKKDASDARENEYLEKLHSGDPKEMAQVSAKAVSSDPKLTREARERMINIVKRETEPETAASISNATASDLLSRIRKPIGDPARIDSESPIYDAFEKGKLNKSDLKFVREELANMRTPEGQKLGEMQEDFLKAVKPQIDKSNPLMDRMDKSGTEQMYRLKLDLQQKIAEFRKAGKDPRSLMTPGSPDYMGSPAALDPYKTTLTQSLQNVTDKLRAKPREDAMPAIPPANQRSPGLYQTPRGTMRWTGTGWVNP